VAAAAATERGTQGERKKYTADTFGHHRFS
jgi:hypothetical protein